MARRNTSRERRRARRAVERHSTAATVPPPTPAELAATGDTGLPLSERADAWDSGAARKSLAEGQYPRAHFWRDPDGDPTTLAAYKLVFANNRPPLTAIWRGVTAAAAVMRGARGGVQIPGGDRAGVRSKINAYYAKAREKYDDPGIQPPWEASTDGEAAALLAYAEAADGGDDFRERLDHWEFEFGVARPAEPGEALPDVPEGAYAEGAAELESLAADVVEVPAVEVLPPPQPSPAPPPAEQRRDASLKRWAATFAPEGSPTDDGRVFAPGAIRWRDTPLTLMAMVETHDGHEGARVAGKIERIYREGGLIRAEGYFDGGEYGQEIARMVGDGVLRGLSVDLAIPDHAILPRSEVLDDDGNYIGPLPDEERGDPDDSPSLIDILFGDEGDELMFVVLDGVIGMATVCPFPAFAEAEIELTAALVAGSVSIPTAATLRLQAGFTVRAEPLEGTGLTASAAGYAPEAPPAAWFALGEPDGLAPLTVTDDGQVYGHAAAWGSCHIGIEGVCVEPPRTETNYACFHHGEVVCEDGSRVAVGQVTLDTGHADRRLGRADSVRHYDDTGTAVADVVAADGEHGIWVCGALRPDADAGLVRKLRGAALSGDWRDVNGNLELVALLAVNVPGFPIPRARAAVAAAGEPHVVALVAAGIVAESLVAAAIGVHHTDTVEGDWDGNAAMTRCKTAADYRAICAWRDSAGDPEQRGSYKFPHHAQPGGPANMAGVRNGLARLPQADIPEGDRAGVERHLRAHLDDHNRRREESGLEPLGAEDLDLERVRAMGAAEELAELAVAVE